MNRRRASYRPCDFSRGQQGCFIVAGVLVAALVAAVAVLVAAL